MYKHETFVFPLFCLFFLSPLYFPLSCFTCTTLDSQMIFVLFSVKYILEIMFYHATLYASPVYTVVVCLSLSSIVSKQLNVG